MSVNYDGRIFRSVKNTDNGEVSSETIFNYYQNDNIVWADYSGGSVVKGSLIANVDSKGNLDMRYHHINTSGDIMTGKCASKPEILDDGRIRLIENWQWTCGDFSKGTSIVQEINKDN